MYLKMIAAGSVLALGLIGATAAQAQSSSLPGSVGSMTCSEFTQLSADAQGNLMTQTDQSNTSTSLTSNSGLGNSKGDGSANKGTAGDALLGAGSLIAACQAASPSSTVQDAYSHFSTGSTSTNSGK